MMLYRVIDWKVQTKDYARQVMVLGNEQGVHVEVPIPKNVSTQLGDVFVSFEPYEADVPETVETTDV